MFRQARVPIARCTSHGPQNRGIHAPRLSPQMGPLISHLLANRFAVVLLDKGRAAPLWLRLAHSEQENSGAGQSPRSVVVHFRVKLETGRKSSFSGFSHRGDGHFSVRPMVRKAFREAFRTWSPWLFQNAQRGRKPPGEQVGCAVFLSNQRRSIARGHILRRSAFLYRAAQCVRDPLHPRRQNPQDGNSQRQHLRVALGRFQRHITELGAARYRTIPAGLQLADFLR